ncbi:2-polyprenyl-3-methyl-5-hydroxy-6-metoxy-1,4-benzoquinol methylase [Quadrisphaera granulorum]|uniref:2-polyprenyl-3-methyl-5-hydroxy-6-metoxy-1, 4-benzoquinol methylase n=1 Tax=Quadrisphaera granulorum TaxID=317664 RepID=A0A316A4Y9_9ACTN|nr:methyltransferase domain-containing protein [Quadrisphaera granulorum]PWJ52609.1 2-polyprenyl-3-methyl-5-hydroxy-6-metoxy-1,4-benzoquinol methylase [Quadrisphaera granulorum]SZE97659.1 2-polyprenyl-3-methyl-5-hydroxy-6-metoxy-1,4-benzoquinol methylase [Quadrisphaera granulorum]
MSPERHADLRDLEVYALDYASSAFEEYQAEVRRRIVLERLALRAPRRVLEVGCGLVSLASFVEDKTTCVVVEPTAPFVTTVRDQLDARHTVVHSTLEDAVTSGALPLDVPFDVIVVSSLLHEVTDPSALMRAVRACCSENTLVHVNAPNLLSLHRRLGMQMGLLRDLRELSTRQKTLQQRAFYDSAGLKAELESVGLSVTAEGGYFLKPFAAEQMSEAVGSGMLDPQVLEALVVLGAQLPELASEIWCEGVLSCA